MYKIKVSDKEFYDIYQNNTIKDAAKILKVSIAWIFRHARKLGFKKNKWVKKIKPEVIPGGLPEL